MFKNLTHLLAQILTALHTWIIPLFFVCVCLIALTIWSLKTPEDFQVKRDALRAESLSEFAHSLSQFWRRNPDFFNTIPVGVPYQVGSSTSGCQLSTETCQVTQEICLDVNSIATPSADLAPDIISGTAQRSGLQITRTGYRELSVSLCHQENKVPQTFLIFADTATRSAGVVQVPF